MSGNPPRPDGILRYKIKQAHSSRCNVTAEAAPRSIEPQRREEWRDDKFTPDLFFSCLLAYYSRAFLEIGITR